MMDLTFQEKDVIKSVIEGFTYHQKYKLYTELAKELKEDDEFIRFLKTRKGQRKITENIPTGKPYGTR